MSDGEAPQQPLLLASVRDTYFLDASGTAALVGWPGEVRVSADALCLLWNHDHESDQESDQCRDRWGVERLNSPRLTALLATALRAKNQADHCDEWIGFGHERDYAEFGHTWRMSTVHPREVLFSLVRERAGEQEPWCYRIDHR